MEIVHFKYPLSMLRAGYIWSHHVYIRAAYSAFKTVEIYFEHARLLAMILVCAIQLHTIIALSFVDIKTDRHTDHVEAKWKILYDIRAIPLCVGIITLSIAHCKIPLPFLNYEVCSANMVWKLNR